MLRIRLSRVGRKHDPSYRVIVTEKGRGPQTGNYVEQVGTYDARSDEHNLKGERITYWIDNGAQPSDTVHNLLLKADIIQGETVNPLPKKSPIVSEAESSDDDEVPSEGQSDESGEETDGDNVDASEDAADDEAEDVDDNSAEASEADEDDDSDEEEE